MHKIREISLAFGAMAMVPCGPLQAAPGKPLAAVPGQAQGQCSIEAIRLADQAAGGTIEIASVRPMTDPVPYCRIDGVVHTSNPGPNTVGFMIALPKAWNGRYLMVIPGGSAGYIVNPSREHLIAGYAVATTDKGSHSGGSLDMSFRADPGKSEDYAHRGAHVAAVATQAIARTYYARERMPRYIMGCSGGGVSTLMEAERYAQDAEGFIVGGAPTNAYVQSFWAAIAQHVARQPESWISPELMGRVGQVILARYDDADGAKDGLIWDPSRIALSRALFPFLSDAQYSTLEMLVRGLPVMTGSEMAAPGYWLANPSALGPIALGAAPPPWDAKNRPPLFGSTVLSMKALRGESYDSITQMDFNDPRQRAEEQAIWDRIGGYGYDPSHLNGLRDTGGKLIMWTGASDEAVPPAYTVNYGNGVRTLYGDASRTFFQSFLIPGMFHCRGGESAPTDSGRTLLEAMQKWVETGRTPGDLLMSNSPYELELNSTSNTAMYVSGMSTQKPKTADPAPPARTYRICALPAVARFTGKPGSDVRDARNWSCSGKLAR